MGRGGAISFRRVITLGNIVLRTCYFWSTMTKTMLSHTNASLLVFNAVDFGVSAQLDRTIGRRNTFIGTPYW